MDFSAAGPGEGCAVLMEMKKLRLNLVLLYNIQFAILGNVVQERKVQHGPTGVL